MKRKIFRSVFTVALVVLLAGIGIAGSFLYGYFINSQTSRLQAELHLVADMVNRAGVEYLEGFESDVFRFTVVGADGTVLYDTKAQAEDMENHGDREEILEALAEGTGSSARNSSTLTRKTVYEAMRLENGDVIRISASRLTVGALVIAMLPFTGVIILISAAVALVLSHGMARKITEPLERLDLENPIENHTYEELTPILEKLHRQHRQITRQVEELHRKTDEFEQVVSSMSEGLVLLDEHGMVLSMNAAARHIFGIRRDTDVRDFLLIDLTEKMTNAVWDALGGKHSEYTENRDGCEYQFAVNPIRSEERERVLGAVILAVDITDRAFAEQNRREFTANVTHELKTPLQSIIGSAELLESGLVREEDRDRFIGNIRKEATRLVNLINDIIRLSQLDEGGETATETVEPEEVAREVIEVLTPSAAKKGVEIGITGHSCRIVGVRRYIYEIIYNLCDNAIRYNVEGGRVTVRLGEEAGHATVEVEDTGIGIAPEHQQRIFERFYRVDKSHSKETGGTGLGLSIVKHAVQYHGARMSLESEPGRGTVVRIIF